MVSFVHKLIRKLAHALGGIAAAFSSDLGFRIDTLLGLLFLFIAYLAWPLTGAESLFLLLSWILILITELQNTSFEVALNRLHPELHDEIGRSKDIAAAAVLIAGCFALCVIAFIVIVRL